MFPLGTVLLPHQTIPLHVFEPRYRAMMLDCLAGDRRFGVVLIERGTEVGGGDVRFDVGTVATIVDAEELPDGRWTLEAVGAERLRVREWLPDDPYPQAEVDVLDEVPWSDDDGPALDGVVAGFHRVVDLARQLGAAVDDRVIDLPGDPHWDAWVIAARAPLADLDRLAVLAAESPSARLAVLRRSIDDVADVLASRLSGG